MYDGTDGRETDGTEFAYGDATVRKGGEIGTSDSLYGLFNEISIKYGEIDMEYKERIIEMVERLQNKEYLELIYHFIKGLLEGNKTSL